MFRSLSSGLRRQAPVPEHRSIIAMDMAGSGRWDNQTQLAARAVLIKAVRTAFRAAGIGNSRIAIEDRGDGMLVLVHAAVSKADLLDPFVPVLAELVHHRNRSFTDDHRIKLRVAMHSGEVHRDGHGWVGADLNLACRLVDCEAAYRLSHDYDFVLVVSEVIYAGVVRHGYRTVDPTRYVPVHVVVKETDTMAWLCMR